MDRQLKERLIGATILVVLAVLVVPEFLSGPKKPRIAHAAALLPSVPTNAPAAMKTYTVDLNRKAASLSVPSEAAATGMSASAPATQSSEPSMSAAPAGAAPVAAPPSAAPATAAAEPMPNAAAANTQSISPAAGWTIQLGSFSNLRNAQRLVRDSRRKGLRAYVVKQGSQQRVRVGPYADRVTAEAAAAKLKSQGRAASIVPP